MDGSAARETRDTPEPSAAAGADGPITVSELSQRVQRSLERRFCDVEVRGELSGLTRRSHWYFSLRDECSVVGCVAWARTASRFDPSLRDGDEVVVRGSLTHYAPQGRTQLVVTSIRPSGAGAQRARFEALCRELKALGWFDSEGKRALPLVPRRVAVITSRSGAAIHDVLATAKRRCPSVPIVLLDVRVQGEGAQASIIRALDAMKDRHEREAIDVVILTRGGGSAEDLDTFNDRGIAEAIRRCAVPVVAAIGHESDLSIAELVADHRASTPTQATMLVLPDARELLESIAHQRRRIDLLVSRLLERRGAALRMLLQHPVLRAPRGVIDLARQGLERRRETLVSRSAQRLHTARVRLDHGEARLQALRPAVLIAAQRRGLHERAERLSAAVRRRMPDARSHARISAALDTSVRRRVRTLRARLAAAQRVLDLTDPASILDRGFSITTDMQGRVLRNAADVAAGDRIVTRLAHGEVASRVDPLPRSK